MRCLVPIAAVLLVACIRQPAQVDAGTADATPGDASIVEPVGLYTECALGSTCEGASQVCLPIRRNGRETAWCTFGCTDDADCPTGICLVASGTIDDRPRCHERCERDEDCADSSFGCETVGIMSSRGTYETQLCYPQ